MSVREPNCSLIMKEERKTVSARQFEVKGRDEEHMTEDVEHSASVLRGGEKKLHTFWCSLDRPRACKMTQASVEKLDQAGPVDK